MQEAKVVTCFLLRRAAGGDEVLLLRRSQQVGTYRGRWAGVSGYLEEADPLAQAYREVEEEVGLTREEVALLRTGEPLEVVDAEAGRRWIVHPFLFEVGPDAQVRVDWEHTEARWVRPEEIFAFDTVPQLAEALMRVYPLQQL
jgi:8-oxo-dGTP diphosphatase